MTDIVENGNSTITFAVLLIVRLRWRLWIDCSLTVLQRTKTHERWNSPEGFERLGLSWLPQRIASMPLRQRATQARQARSRGRTEKLYRCKHRFNFRLERRAPHKPLKLLARPKRFELLTPRFVVRGQRQEAAHLVSPVCRAPGADGVFPICTLQRAEVCDAVTRPFARQLGRPRWGAPERSGPCRDDVEPVSG
jgi:hypothetical protein